LPSPEISPGCGPRWSDGSTASLLEETLQRSTKLKLFLLILVFSEFAALVATSKTDSVITPPWFSTSGGTALQLHYSARYCIFVASTCDNPNCICNTVD